jgi:NlpC/P60 family/Bacterial SH3 domain
MSVHRRAPRRLLVFILAVPIVVAVYLSAFGIRIWSVVRLIVAAMLGATVISSVYADEAVRRGPASVRRGIETLPAAGVTPLRAAAVAALAITLVTTGMAPAPTFAAQPSEAVVAAARAYIGTPYRLGAEGPRAVDCSGLVYAAFSDAGELPRVGGRRLRAVGYMRYFVTRGLASKKDGRRGDLVVYGKGRHIGFYLGDGRVLSALTEGVSVHSLHGISYKFDLFLHVDWSAGDGRPVEKDKDKDKGPDKSNNPDPVQAADGGEAVIGDGSNDDEPDPQPAEPQVLTGLAIGTMNLRAQADPEERIIGWVSRGTTFKILGDGRSPGGALWYNVETRSGKTGWIYSRWVRPLD